MDEVRKDSATLGDSESKTDGSARSATLEKVGPSTYLIDSRFLGLGKLAAVYYLDAERPAIIETSGSLCAQRILEILEDAGIDTLAYIIVSHIHLDHAGGVGDFHERFPDAQVVVHPRGARHLADPERLHRSVESVYGKEAVQHRWGYMKPVDASSILAAEDLDKIDLGGGRHLQILHTPGHAKHHMAILDESTEGVFLGDSAGVYLSDADFLAPSSPPPDLDPHAACASLDRIIGCRPKVAYFSHFGPAVDPARTLEAAKNFYQEWLEIAQSVYDSGKTLDDLADVLKEREKVRRRQLDADASKRLEELVPIEVQAEGYWNYLISRDSNKAVQS
jgi:glyoxylase-like metal-dependent hydrolase (beta-lactamase superfamily II)